MIRTERPLLVYALALVIGLVFVASLFQLSALFPANPLDVPLVGDEAISAIGQRYFLGSPWQWPLLHVGRLNAPDGTEIGLTDSIPLAMLLLKPWRGVLPPGFFVQTLWVAFAWLFQPAAGVYALRGTGERRVLPAIAVALLAISLPSLLLRYGAHMALCTHAAMLLALGLYFRLCRPGATHRLWTAAFALMLAALLVHPYILLMSAAFLGAAPLTLLMRRDPRWRGAAIRFAASFAVVAVVAKLLGYGGTQPAPGFGYYSMNLFGPFLPSFSTLFGNRAIDGTGGGQGFEGMQYLGAGVLLLLAVAAVVAALRPQPLRRHLGLLLVVLALSAFSLSSQVYAGHRLLLDITNVPEVVTQFRSTGRFFWPVAYAIIVVGVATIAATFRPWVAYALLAVCCTLQLADTAGLRTRANVASGGEAWVLDLPALAPVFAAHTRLTMWPVFGCGASAANAVDMQVMLIASRTRMITNTMYLARNRTDAECDGARGLTQPLEPGELRVINNRAPAAWNVPDADRHCRQSPHIVLCSLADAALAGLQPLQVQELALGQYLMLNGPDADGVLSTGWSAPEPVGVWSEGGQAVLHFRQPLNGQPHELHIDGVTLPSTPGGTQQVSVSVDGARPSQWQGGDMAPLAIAVPVPADQQIVTVTLRIAHPVRPMDRGMGPDPRVLGFMLVRLQLSSPAA